MKKSLNYRILDDYDEILNHLHLGINIPVDGHFKKYIKRDLEELNAKSIIIQENEEVIARVCESDSSLTITAPRDFPVRHMIDKKGFFKTVPHRDGTDGFFGATLMKR